MKNRIFRKILSVTAAAALLSFSAAAETGADVRFSESTVSDAVSDALPVENYLGASLSQIENDIPGVTEVSFSGGEVTESDGILAVTAVFDDSFSHASMIIRSISVKSAASGTEPSYSICGILPGMDRSSVSSVIVSSGFQAADSSDGTDGIRDSYYSADTGTPLMLLAEYDSPDSALRSVLLRYASDEEISRYGIS